MKILRVLIHISNNNFAIIKGLSKKFFIKETIKFFYKIAILYIKCNSKIQMHSILIKLNPLSDMLLYGQYIKIANKYFFL